MRDSAKVSEAFPFTLPPWSALTTVSIMVAPDFASVRPSTTSALASVVSNSFSVLVRFVSTASMVRTAIGVPAATVYVIGCGGAVVRRRLEQALARGPRPGAAGEGPGAGAGVAPVGAEAGAAAVGGCSFACP